MCIQQCAQFEYVGIYVYFFHIFSSRWCGSVHNKPLITHLLFHRVDGSAVKQHGH